MIRDLRNDVLGRVGVVRVPQIVQVMRRNGRRSGSRAVRTAGDLDREAPVEVPIECGCQVIQRVI